MRMVEPIPAYFIFHLLRRLLLYELRLWQHDSLLYERQEVFVRRLDADLCKVQDWKDFSWRVTLLRKIMSPMKSEL